MLVKDKWFGTVSEGGQSSVEAAKAGVCNQTTNNQDPVWVNVSVTAVFTLGPQVLFSLVLFPGATEDCAESGNNWLLILIPKIP